MSRCIASLGPAGLACATLLAASALSSAAQTPSTSEPATQSKPPGAADRSTSAKRLSSPAEFDKTVKAATDARQSENWEQAIELYAKAVRMKPDFVEGFWYQGAAYYQLDRHVECRDSFRKVIRLAPRNGAGFGFLGLCEFELKDYDRALQHFLKSRLLGIGDNKDLIGVARYHAAILMTRNEQYEQALQTLGEFTGEGNDNPRVIEAMGIATLRMPLLPTELPPDRREMVLMAGRASYLMATRMPDAAGKAFEALVMRYPDTPNVHYAYGVHLLQEQPDKAIGEFKRELELQPNSAWAMMQIAYEYLKRGDSQAALPWAKQAVAAAPNAFPARKALGQALLDTGDAPGAILELETGIKLAPDSPGLHYTLARAYQRAGRADDATRARNEFSRLDRLGRSTRSGGQSVGGIDMERAQESPAPPQ